MVPTTRRIHRPAIVVALACALLVSALSGAAVARPVHDSQTRAALAQERYHSSFGEAKPLGRPAGEAKPSDRVIAAALAQERYYSSYGDPEPLAPPQSPVASDDTPWLPVALSLAATLAIVAAGAAHLRRLRIRRRRAARATT
jgi:hypothetical protein